MARSRTVKPSFFLNEFMAQNTPHARLLFIGLLQQADVKGRLEDRPLRLKAAVFPYEDVDVDALLNELTAGPEYFIVRYEANGNRYIEIQNFSKHQNPNLKEKQAGSQIPPRSIGGDMPGTFPGRSWDVPESDRDVTGMNQGHNGDVPGMVPAQPITLTLLPITHTQDPMLPHRGCVRVV
jgi:hypothetical protein